MSVDILKSCCHQLVHPGTQELHTWSRLLFRALICVAWLFRAEFKLEVRSVLGHWQKNSSSKLSLKFVCAGKLESRLEVDSGPTTTLFEHISTVSGLRYFGTACYPSNR